MVLIQSMVDLDQARVKALERQRSDAKIHRVHIRIGMASCSIAAGARDTFHAVEYLIANENLPGVSADEIRISSTGCVGLCALEPIVQVQIADQPLVTYGKVTPEVAQRILQEHIGKGLVVQENVVENV